MYDKILVAIDKSPVSDRAVLAGRDVAQLSNGEVWVLHLREFEPAAPADWHCGLSFVGVTAATGRGRRAGR
jgi:nucleotide-binding universal stress UspA family protein